jgi:cytochrome c biogenesis factor
MSGRASLSPLERWFDKLVKNKMGGAALPIAGIAIGLFLVECSRIIPAPHDQDVAQLGILIMYASGLLLILAIASLCYLHVRAQFAMQQMRKKE